MMESKGGRERGEKGVGGRMVKKGISEKRMIERGMVV